MVTHEVIEYLYRQEPDDIIGNTCHVEVQKDFERWCLDIAEELEIEDEFDVISAVAELESIGFLYLNSEDYVYIYSVEFKKPRNRNQLEIPFHESSASG